MHTHGWIFTEELATRAQYIRFCGNSQPDSSSTYQLAVTQVAE